MSGYSAMPRVPCASTPCHEVARDFTNSNTELCLLDRDSVKQALLRVAVFF